LTASFTICYHQEDEEFFEMFFRQPGSFYQGGIQEHYQVGADEQNGIALFAPLRRPVETLLEIR